MEPVARFKEKSWHYRIAGTYGFLDRFLDRVEYNPYKNGKLVVDVCTYSKAIVVGLIIIFLLVVLGVVLGSALMGSAMFMYVCETIAPIKAQDIDIAGIFLWGMGFVMLGAYGIAAFFKWIGPYVDRFFYKTGKLIVKLFPNREDKPTFIGTVYRSLKEKICVFVELE